MALREIVVDGDPILRKTSRPVEKFDEKLATLLDDCRCSGWHFASLLRRGCGR